MTEHERSATKPTHVPGTSKGEELALGGREVGRETGRKHYQDARDATGINADARQPIHPDMPHLPPS